LSWGGSQEKEKDKGARHKQSGAGVGYQAMMPVVSAA